MADPAYLRMPALHGDAVTFVAEDDLWTVPVAGGIARRLTAARGECTLPRYSPDGGTIAYVGREEGHAEIYTIPAAGGPSTRLTYLGADAMWLCGWTPDGGEIVFTTDARQPFPQHSVAYAIAAGGGAPREFPWGHVRTIALHPGGGTAIGRNAHDPARWKRYRGGTAGAVWVDARGSGRFERILRDVAGNVCWPLWVGDELVVLSDHEGIGNLYACAPDGGGLRPITAESTYFARWPSTDGARVVYTAGAELAIVDATGNGARIAVDVPSGATQAQRRYVEAGDFLERYGVSPDGTQVGLVARGRAYTMPLWEQAVSEHGDDARRRELVWLHDGERIAFVQDDGEGERIVVARIDQNEAPRVVAGTAIGRVTSLVASPANDRLAYTNHRQEIAIVDLGREPRVLDTSPAGPAGELAFSPDGRWLAYVVSPHHGTSVVRIADADAGTTHAATLPLRTDRAPAWDPDGKYLYLISSRDFEPVYDALQFELSFPAAMRPYLLTLRRDLPDPFVAQPAPVHGKRDDADDDEDDEREKKPAPVVIDLDGLPERMLGFPVEPGQYQTIAGVRGRALFSSFPLRGIRPHARDDDDDDHGGTLVAYDFEQQRSAVLASDLDDFVVGADARSVVYRSRDRLRAIDAGGDLPEDPPDDDRGNGETGRKSGWLDLARIPVLVEPRREWLQMYREAWRLQREQFWDPAMSGVDWEAVRTRYETLLPRVRTRTELSDVIWEMHGELGTSHAYEWGGDFRPAPPYRRGFLGADFVWDDAAGGWRIANILRGDPWNRDEDSPLAAPGVDVRAGDVVVAVGNRALDATTPPQAHLVNLAGREVALTILRDGERRRTLVKTLRDERMLRYRAWVRRNRDEVHRRSGGRAGYVHIPDMGPWGFSEFHRGYLGEFDRDGLIVDLRYNRGGHVSGLLLEKLRRTRIGYDVSRWFPPVPYPEESVAGPLVAITNQFAGSDGDIFSHGWKLYDLGPLVGMRTWGGVVGINPTHQLVDGTLTTQPEFSFWFTDAGWNVENYGTDPTHEVDIAPHDTVAGVDPQLDLALELLGQRLPEHRTPDFGTRPIRRWAPPASG